MHRFDYSFLDNGMLPEEILVGWCEQATWVDDYDWVYRCRFEKEKTSSKVRICFGGLDTLADIYLNGTLIGTNEDFYLPQTIDVTDTGTGIPEVLSGYLGINWYDVILDLALGREVRLPREEGAAPRAALSRMIISDREGTLKSLGYTAEGHEVRDRDWTGEKIRVTLNAVPGQHVRPFVNGTERLGQAVFIGESRQEILRAEADFLRDVRVETEEEGTGKNG